jgi:hypothetical protein
MPNPVGVAVLDSSEGLAGAQGLGDEALVVVLVLGPDSLLRSRTKCSWKRAGTQSM